MRVGEITMGCDCSFEFIDFECSNEFNFFLNNLYFENITTIEIRNHSFKICNEIIVSKYGF